MLMAMEMHLKSKKSKLATLSPYPVHFSYDMYYIFSSLMLIIPWKYTWTPGNHTIDRILCTQLIA